MLLLSEAVARHVAGLVRGSNYRRRVVRWPRQVLAEFGTIIPRDVEVRVHDFEPEDALHGPADVPGRDRGLERGKADGIITRDTMIGVALPDINWTTASMPLGERSSGLIPRGRSRRRPRTCEIGRNPPKGQRHGFCLVRKPIVGAGAH